MTTYLLNAHYTLLPITAARTLSSILELSSTVIMPLAVSFSSKASSDSLTPLVRVGLWGLSWQILTLLPATLSFLLLPNTASTPVLTYPLLNASFFIFLSLSRLGLWTYSLAEQTLVQVLVPSTQRVEFSGVEMAFISAAEIGRWGITAIFSRPDQFKGVACSGLGVVAGCVMLYYSWVRRRWGTLVNLQKIEPRYRN